jgi:DNA-binding MarR family transcriptional regulator
VTDLRRLSADIIRLGTEIWDAVDARLKAEFGLRLTEFGPMSVVGRLPGCRVYDIASGLRITTGGASKLVDRMEASGYCRRLPNPDDRRSSLLELTVEGELMVTKAGAAVDEELQRLLGSALPERTLRQFAVTLTRLRIAADPTKADIEESAWPGSPPETAAPALPVFALRTASGSVQAL